ISSRFLGKRKFIQSVADGIRWGEEFPGVFQLLIVPEEETTKTVVDGISYKGSLYVYNIAETGTISIVNEVLLDDYLDSVLSNQFNKERLSEEAAAAVAIVARTNALYFALNPKSAFWSVDGTEVGYLGNSNIKFASPVVQAIEATRKMVMSQASNEGTKPFPAEWAQLLDQTKKDAKLAAITLQDAERLAQKGDHAAEILKKAFPGTSIQLTD
ncbi:MAG TPA: SpoIID/LytB domain-containing protein, partial [Parachlamydiaceae bacterium]|nr:SpoIID/LytB domain-containing protein [Parachlamydiaceae bacterium]